MSNSAHEHLEKIWNEGTEFRIGKYISTGFEIWKKYAGGFILFTLIFFIAFVAISFIPFIGGPANNLWFVPVISLGGSIVSHKIYLNLPKSTEDFTAATKDSWQIILSQLITNISAMILMIPFFLSFGLQNLQYLMSGEFIFMDDWASEFRIWHLSWLLPPVVIYVLLSYATHFIYFYRLPALEAIKYSAKFVYRHWLSVFLFFVLIVVIALSGLIVLLFGVIVTFSMLYPMLYYSFRGLTRLDEYLQNRGEVEGLV